MPERARSPHHRAVSRSRSICGRYSAECSFESPRNRETGGPTMRWYSLSVVLIMVIAVGPADGKVEQGWLPTAEHPSFDVLIDDSPLRPPEFGIRADTTWYGQYEVLDGEYYAIPYGSKTEAVWSFESGLPTGDPDVIEGGEGWKAIDRSAQTDEYFRVIDGTLDLGEGVEPPIINGDYSLWVGADKPTADELCWECGAGYGNTWCQRITSPAQPYTDGDVAISFDYWSFSEPCFDGTQLYLERADGTRFLLNPYPEGECANNLDWVKGTFTDSIGHPEAPEHYERTVTADEIDQEPGTEIQFVFEFYSDVFWSDEDCDFPTEYGPFGADDISITGNGIDAFYDFETGDSQDWTPGVCKAVGTFAGVAPLADYTILDPCGCKLEGNILECHDGLGDQGVHPEMQHVRFVGPTCWFGTDEPKDIFVEFDLYAEMPRDNGVMLAGRWFYYPWTCEHTGEVGWSPYAFGESNWHHFGDDPSCLTVRYGGTQIEDGPAVPSTALGVRPLIEVMSDCAAFTINDCTGVTNPSPLLDNIVVAVTEPPVAAPVIRITANGRLQDVGSNPSSHLDPRAPGPANTTYNLNHGLEDGPYRGGDTLTVIGPEPVDGHPETRWEARLWWRIAKRAPFQADMENGAPSRYKIWKDRTSDGIPVDDPDAPQFAWGLMDSVDLGFYVSDRSFATLFREDDDDFVGEENPENEILWDDVFYPGTRVEYFITSNYVQTPSIVYHLPDTTGGYFYEFEVLPGLRTANVPDCGGQGFDYCVFQPSILYIDGYDRGAQVFIENALRTVLNGEDPCQSEYGCPIPKNRNWDRFDIGWVPCAHNVPFARLPVPGSEGGMTLQQILGYRAILLNTGSADCAPVHDVDFELFDQWLRSPECNANVNRQVFVFNGDRIGENLFWDDYGSMFLRSTLGAEAYCKAFHGDAGGFDLNDCGDLNTSYCLRFLEADDASYPTEIDVDAYGNWCPNKYSFNAYHAVEGGLGSRYYSAEDGTKEMLYAQITNENLSADANYRTIVGSPSWHHLTARDAGGQGEARCPRDLPSVVEAGIAEIGAALKWGFEVESYEEIPMLSNLQDLMDCQGTGDLPAVAGEGVQFRVTRLYQNRPNPFSPETTISFSLAREGPVAIRIYDVGGRCVRTLVDGKMKAGPHNLAWDGTNNQGIKVGAGVYWAQMEAGSYSSNKKMIILK
ncbi:MAG: hypothetical protein GF346_01645 [Candidatus Eisenbacteria bacterium]|nr:hypothetical protein [Candidatus Latescibacterota bacterium]MBD3301134.1 hypothetical protein [Candidatus Eisenbacteria bacterium]